MINKNSVIFSSQAIVEVLSIQMVFRYLNTIGSSDHCPLPFTLDPEQPAASEHHIFVKLKGPG